VVLTILASVKLEARHDRESGSQQMKLTTLITGLLVALVASSAGAHDPTAPAPATHEVGKEHGSLADISRKLSDPTSNVWALFTEFDLRNLSTTLRHSCSLFSEQFLLSLMSRVD
jgi:hypothetical protein